ncbi:polysaccharide biosynthesis tyrosine autokinase [Paraburkholderia phosphatilytica]|uniref:polysaccharide biosynthesis tyrosine autokinase n=1 Tax=Paraburkholderia phosphatilytica TaxID=2282883 RepID=UPI000E4AA234|nr:polysaccharide biosynthesis tyrosine autokinase [Paraburkholderia phosphatilytica]
MSTYDMLEPAPQPGSEDEEVMHDLFRMIFDQIWWVLGIAGAVILASIIYAKTATHIYSADALIQVETPTSSTSSSAALSAPSTSSNAPHTDAEIEIMRSRTVVEPVVEAFKLNFQTVPKQFPILGSLAKLFATEGTPQRPWFGLSSYAWGGEKFTVDSISVPKALEGSRLMLRALGDGRFELLDAKHHLLLTGVAGVPATGHDVSILVSKLVARAGTEFYVTRANQLDAVMNLANGLQISEKGHETGVVQLSLQGIDPKQITAIVNSVAQSYLQARTERAQEEASKMLSFLNSEVPHLRDELKRSETALSQYQARVGTFQPTQEAQVYLSGGLEYEKQIAALRIERAQLMQKFTSDSLEVQTIDAQINALSREKSNFEDHFKELPGSEREAVSLQRDAKVNEEVYVTLLNRIQELSITRAGTVGNVHIVDEALVPLSPVRPKAALIVAAGTMLGIILGIAFAFVRRKFLTGVRDPDEVERRFRLPVLGAISFSVEQAQADRLAYERNGRRLGAPAKRGLLAASASKGAGGVSGAFNLARRVMPILQSLPSTHAKEADAARNAARGTAKATPNVQRTRARVLGPDDYAPSRPLLVKTAPFAMSVEGVRGLRTTLQFGLVDAPNRIVCITSPAPSDGKSFLCANLAALLSEAGQRVVLIDADLRRGRLAQYFGKSPAGGLTELLTGQIDFDVAARSTGVDGLHFISAGAYPPNPSEILSSSRFTQMLNRFEQEFDLVIVDTPPLLAAPDAAVVANLAGSTILVMRAGAHTEANITESLKKLRRARARVVGAVMNGTEPKRGSRYGTYEYAYAYTYSADVTPVEH